MKIFRKNHFFRWLHFYRWAIFCGVIILGVSGLVLLGIAKIVDVMPEHMELTQKRSFLDLIQADQLASTARQMAEKEDLKSTTRVWVQAIQQNPGNADHIRSMLEFLLENDRVSSEAIAAMNMSRWLLKLSSTNHSDAVLVARVYDHYGLQKQSLELLDDHGDGLGSGDKSAYVRLLFENRKFNEFYAAWSRLGEEEKNLPEMRMMSTAWDYGFSENLDQADAARSELLEHIQDNPAHAGRLRITFLMAAHRGDLVTLESVLENLQLINAAQPVHHHTYWKILHLNGRSSEARKKAIAYNFPPRGPDDFTSQLETLLMLDLNSQAYDYIDKYIDRFPGFPLPWFEALKVLASKMEWDRLADCSDRLLSNPSMIAHESLGRFFRGIAYHRMNRFDRAATMFEGLKTKSLTANNAVSQDLIPMVITELSDFGYPETAAEIFDGLTGDENFSESLSYWKAGYKLALAARDLNRAFLASEKLYTLEPENYISLFNFASCLISFGDSPDESLMRMEMLMELRPGWIPGLINHALALIQNGKLVEADRILYIEINPGAIPDSLKSDYYLALFELKLMQGDTEKALEISQLIDPKTLFKVEESRIRNQISSLRSKAEMVSIDPAPHRDTP